jgi:hypothetical protein
MYLETTRGPSYTERERGSKTKCGKIRRCGAVTSPQQRARFGLHSVPMPPLAAVTNASKSSRGTAI